MIRSTMRLNLSRINQCLYCYCVRSCPLQRTPQPLQFSRFWSSAAAIKHQRSDVFTKSALSSDVSSPKPVLPLFVDSVGAENLLENKRNTDSTRDTVPIHPASGFGRKLNNDGSVYTGYFLNSKFHGNGTLEFADGCVFKGLFKEGRIARGTGKHSYDNGEVYDGTIVNNKKHGKGTLCTPDGTRYESTWRGNRMYGECTVRYANGETFQGTHRMKVPDNGYGWTVTSEGMLYEGEWLNGVYHGRGTLYTADGCVLKGWWKDGQMHGRGMFLNAKGNLETGTWTNGKLKADKKRRPHHSDVNSSGPAVVGDIDTDNTTSTLFDFTAEPNPDAVVINYPDGTTYVGEMKDNRRHGQGTLTFRNGSTYQGEFVEGIEHGYGVATTSSTAGSRPKKGKAGHIKRGEVYKGQFLQGKRHGEGQLISAAGDVFTGIFKNNSIESGSGTVTYPFGRSFTGTYKGGMRHGPGKLIEEDGSSIEVNFVNNKPHGEGVFTSRVGDVIYELWDMGRLVKQTSEKRSAPLTDEKEKSSNIILDGDKGTIEGASGDAIDGDNINTIAETTPATTATVATTFSERVFKAEKVTLHFEDDSIYTGHCIKGIPNGKGKIKYTDGSHYSGSFTRGLKHGQGKHFYKHINCTYEGLWERGNRHGEGTLTYHDTDETFIGEFKYGRVISGNGVYYSLQKIRFEGEFAYGYLIQGKITYLDGSVYEGEVCDGLRHGQGTLTDKDGTVVYSGQWKEGEQSDE